MTSHRDDVTLANPFGGIMLGWEAVAETIEKAATFYKEGKVTFENIAKYLTSNLACIVEIEN